MKKRKILALREKAYFPNRSFEND